MKVYGQTSGQDLVMDRQYEMALACDLGFIIPTVQALALGQPINVHSALSFGYCGWPKLIYKNKTRQTHELTWNMWVVLYGFSLLMPSAKLENDVFQNVKVKTA